MVQVFLVPKQRKPISLPVQLFIPSPNKGGMHVQVKVVDPSVELQVAFGWQGFESHGSKTAKKHNLLF